ncbi:MAG TPA: putative Ig domain-containing protein, partial [Vicinamibacterales bacterium]|nr:putative Ig domain-containing protein [Vicinamibacterales bacterium]
MFTTLLTMAPAAAYAQTVTAAWDPSPASDQVTGYQVCVGTSSLSCNVALASVSASATSYTFSPTGGVLHYVAIRALNAAGTGPYSSEITFSIPGFTQPLNQSNPTGTAISPLNLSVADPDGGTLGFTHTGLPPGLSLDPANGRITGIPSAAGTYTVTVYVDDGLVTVSRTWSWTITSAQPDTQAPTLTISSHSSGQTVTSANVTISGTATDNNRGGRGVTSVSVNGVATGATATGNNTANWSRSITLTSGANTITIEATDGAGNVSMQQLTLTASLAPAAVTGATLTPNVASPEDVGASITFSATGSGGVAPRQFKFLVAQGGGAAQVVQNWSTSSSYTWTPTTAASYTVSVWVRSAGVTTDVAQASAQVAYTINTPPISPVTGATLTPNVASPQNTGTSVTFTAAGSGGVAPRQFKFLVAQGGGAPQTVQNWSTSSTYTWTPTAAGSYTVSVWARSAGVTTDVAQASAQVAYTINTPPPSPVTSATLSPNVSSPQVS